MTKRKKHCSPKTIRLNEQLSNGRCQRCLKLKKVFYFCEKNLYFNKKIAEIQLCEDCLNALIEELSEVKDIKRKVYLPILKFMKYGKEEHIINESETIQNQISESL